MDVNELLRLNKITKGQYDIYLIFEMSDIGKNLYQQWIKRYVLEEDHTQGQFLESGFSFFGGRISFLQDIHRDIQFVQMKLKELQNA